MAAAYEIGQLRGTPLHAAQLIWLATAGSAQSLHLSAQIGSIAAGKEADLTVLNLRSTPAIAQRADHATDIWESLFATIMMGDDRAIADVWIAGRRRS
jgi:guanine deaminase